MATHSRLREFNPAVEDWISYAERLEFYFAANEVTEADTESSPFQCLRCCYLQAYQEFTGPSQAYGGRFQGHS